MRSIKYRQLEIILTLNQKKKTTLSELSALFEVSKRTIMRDLDAISALGVPVYTQQGYGGGIYLDESYQFDQSFFTSQEISDLVLALHIADQLTQGNHKSTLLKKLELLLPELTLAKEHDFSEYVKVTPLLAGFNLNDPIVQKINLGLDDEIFLDVTYKEKAFRVAPLYYAIGADGIALCATDGQQKYRFLLSQMTACAVTDLEFEREQFKNFLSHEGR